MKIGIIRYPGSNCDYDVFKFFDYFKYCVFIWHKETILPDIDILVIPGGFAFGDRYYEKATSKYTISPGQMAIESPVTKVILEAVEKNIIIIGICNGFQILTKLGLLPGSLEKNDSNKFECRHVTCNINIFGNNYEEDLWIANSYGKYVVNEDDYKQLQEKDQIFLTYKNYSNGSIGNIGGICNTNKTIYGMMPHPERNQNPIFNKQFFLFIHDIYFKNKINNLMESEHVSYKSTKKYLKTLLTCSDRVIQGPGENAGIVDIGDGYCIALRIESHNHPIFIDPYEGAATGVGGILRDIFTMGARPIAILDFLRFGNDDNSDKLLDLAVTGISDYGNCIGVPNVGGDLYRDDTYNNNPLLNVACLGIVKKENIIYGSVKETNNLLIYVGSKTGNDGVGGADMASKEFKEITEDLKQNIQKGDPFLEKLLLEACCEIAELKLADGMQDMGAGGLLCASVEVIKRGREKQGENFGCNIYLNKVPIKYEMDLCNILISESQERMLIISNDKNKQQIFDIFAKWDLEYSVIGNVNDSGFFSVYNNDEIVYCQQMSSFKDISENWSEEVFPIQETIRTKIKNMEKWTVYDSTVGCRTIKGPNKSGSYSILDIYEINKIIILTWAEDCQECYDEMIKLKGTPLCMINCLNFGHPKDSMGTFAETIKKMNAFGEKYKIPVVGGNVSLYNSTNNVSIKPTPIFVMMGLIN